MSKIHMQSAKSAVFFLQVCNHNGLCKYRFDWSGKAEMATKYATLVTCKDMMAVLLEPMSPAPVTI